MEMQDAEELESNGVNMDQEQKVRKSNALQVKKIGSKEKTTLKKEKLQQAAKELQQGKFKSLRYVLLTHKIHLGYNIAYTSLYKGMSNHCGEDFRGSGGQFSKILSQTEELEIVNHVKWKAQIGYGVTWERV